jgi:hypothetical protein
MSSHNFVAEKKEKAPFALVTPDRFRSCCLQIEKEVIL